jgi:transposase
MEQGKVKKVRRHFDEQFKIDAVRLASENGKPVAEVARELGIGRGLLDRWKRAIGTKSPAAAFPGNGNLGGEKKELEELRRELARVKEEREILKKAMAVFSRRP